MATIVHSTRYDPRLFGLERSLPDEVRRRGPLVADLRDRLPAGRPGPDWCEVTAPASRDDLLRVHGEEYLDHLADPATLASLYGLPWLRFLPRGLAATRLLEPQFWITGGTIMAMTAACETGLACNVAGGFHDARGRDHGRPGAVNDVAVGIAHLWRQQGRSRVLVVDADARQGVGTAAIFRHESQVVLVDVFNVDTGPDDGEARERSDYPVLLSAGTGDRKYLEESGSALAAAVAAGGYGLAVYLAGANVLEGVAQGGLAVTAEGLKARDLLVLQTLWASDIPTVVLPAGGNPSTARCQADSLAAAMSAHAQPRARAGQG